MMVTITGASGFVGRSISPFLTRNGIKINSLSLRNDNWQLDNRSKAIIHLAGIEKDTGNEIDLQEYFKVNAYLTEKVFKKFLKSDIKDFIFFSSIKAIADTSSVYLEETQTPNPISAYGKSKFLAETLLFQHPLPLGKRLIILRPGLIHGPEDKGNLNLLFKLVKKGIPYPLGSFANRRSYLTVDNLAFVLDYILRNDHFSSGVYHIADDEPIATTKIVELMYEVQGRKSKILKVPPKFLQRLVKVFSYLGVRILEEKLTKLTADLKICNLKIKNEMSLSNLPLTSEKGLEQTISEFHRQEK